MLWEIFSPFSISYQRLALQPQQQYHSKENIQYFSCSNYAEVQFDVVRERQGPLADMDYALPFLQIQPGAIAKNKD